MRSILPLSQVIEKAKQDYAAYQAQQANFISPVAEISIEPNDNNACVEVYIETKFNNTSYHFESMKPEHATVIYDVINSSQPVRSKFADGATKTLEQTIGRIKTLSDRFVLDESGQPLDSKLHLYGGFVVTDAEVEDEEKAFLGMVNLGGGSTADNHTEMARLNKESSWSNIPEGFDIVLEHNSRRYQGLGTAEACTLVQYAQLLKEKEYKINGQELEAIVATSRLDNPGSWKSNAKAGFTVRDVDQNINYGPELRYQLIRPVL